MLDETCDVKPDLESLQSSLAKGSDRVEPSQESVGFAAEVLVELGDVIHIQEHVGTPTAPNESNWPPKHSYKTFVKDFQTEEEGENANSLSEDSNIISDTQEMGQTVSKSKSRLPGGFIESEEDEEGNDEQSVSDIPEGERKDKPEDDQETQEATAEKNPFELSNTGANSTTDVGVETHTTMGGLSGAIKGTKMNPEKVLGILKVIPCDDVGTARRSARFREKHH